MRLEKSSGAPPYRMFGSGGGGVSRNVSVGTVKYSRGLRWGGGGVCKNPSNSAQRAVVAVAYHVDFNHLRNGIH